MRQVIRQILLMLGTIALLLSLKSCGGRSDESKAIAEDKNSEKFDTKSGEKDAQFVVDVVSESYGELLLADAALTRTTDQEIKDVASLLKTESVNTLDHMKKYAASKAISIPTEATDKDQNRAKDISAGKEFDKVWCEEMRDRHRRMIDNLENAAASMNDNELKSWTNKTLNRVRGDHDKLMACHERLK